MEFPCWFHTCSLYQCTRINYSQYSLHVWFNRVIARNIDGNITPLLVYWNAPAHNENKHFASDVYGCKIHTITNNNTPFSGKVLEQFGRAYNFLFWHMFNGQTGFTECSQTRGVRWSYLIYALVQIVSAICLVCEKLWTINSSNGELLKGRVNDYASSLNRHL